MTQTGEGIIVFGVVVIVRTLLLRGLHFCEGTIVVVPLLSFLLFLLFLLWLFLLFWSFLFLLCLLLLFLF